MDKLVYGLILVALLVIVILLERWFSKGDYSGTIYVNKNEDKIVYSLELDGDPEELQFKKEVRFKVNTSDERKT